jgi:hypothetical protein
MKSVHGGGTRARPHDTTTNPGQQGLQPRNLQSAKGPCTTSFTPRSTAAHRSASSSCSRLLGTRTVHGRCVPVLTGRRAYHGDVSEVVCRKHVVHAVFGRRRRPLDEEVGAVWSGPGSQRETQHWCMFQQTGDNDARMGGLHAPSRLHERGHAAVQQRVEGHAPAVTDGVHNASVAEQQIKALEPVHAAKGRTVLFIA